MPPDPTIYNDTPSTRRRQDEIDRIVEWWETEKRRRLPEGQILIVGTVDLEHDRWSVAGYLPKPEPT